MRSSAGTRPGGPTAGSGLTSRARGVTVHRPVVLCRGHASDTYCPVTVDAQWRLRPLQSQTRAATLTKKRCTLLGTLEASRASQRCGPTGDAARKAACGGAERRISLLPPPPPRPTPLRPTHARAYAGLCSRGPHRGHLVGPRHAALDQQRRQRRHRGVLGERARLGRGGRHGGPHRAGNRGGRGLDNARTLGSCVQRSPGRCPLLAHHSQRAKRGQAGGLASLHVQ